MEDIRTTRQTLIQRLKDTENEDAWKEFYDFYWQLISGWAQRFGCSPAKADDVFQETMVCLLRQIPSFEYDPVKGSFRSYLKTIVKGRCYDLFRKESRYVAVGDSGDENEQLSSALDILSREHSELISIDDDNIWLYSLVHQALRRVYGKIDQQTYKSFCLYVLEGGSVGEVSRKLGNLRTGTIYQQKSRMLKMLEKEFLILLDEMGETPVGSQSRGLFIKAVEEMINNHPEYRETMINKESNCPDIRIFEKIKPALQELPEPGKNQSCLCIIEEAAAARWYKLTGTATAGSKDECDLVFKNDRQVSGMHLEISRKDDAFLVRDLHSANGTYLNNRRLTQAAELCDGDIISLSKDSILVFNRFD
ncbi:MAG: sigma-70 family RNA polymerase sigma factor [Victivallaceae bacterium]|nr:sigma-70 family RNA polymerase sigma factor [Victivallaceae bacterium]